MADPVSPPFNPISAVFRIGKAFEKTKLPDPRPGFTTEIAALKERNPEAAEKIEAETAARIANLTGSARKIAVSTQRIIEAGRIRARNTPGVDAAPVRPDVIPPKVPPSLPPPVFVGETLPSFPATNDFATLGIRDRVLAAIERSIAAAKPKPRLPPPKPRRRPRPKTKPEPRRRTKPRSPPRKPDKPMRRLPLPVEIVRRALESGRAGIDEAIRRLLEKQRKGPTTRPPGAERPQAQKPPDLPPVTADVPELNQAVIREAEQKTTPRDASQARREPSAIPSPSPRPTVQTVPVVIPQAPTLPSAAPSSFPALTPLALLALRAATRSRPTRAPGRPASPGSPARAPIRGLAEALSPLRAPREALDRCWVQCRKKGPKQKRKKKICLTPQQAGKLGIKQIAGRLTRR